MRIGCAEFDDEVIVFFSFKAKFVREISFRDENGTAVFRDERMVILQLLPPLLDFSPGLAGADDERDVSLF